MFADAQPLTFGRGKSERTAFTSMRLSQSVHPHSSVKFVWVAVYIGSSLSCVGQGFVHPFPPFCALLDGILSES